MNKISEWLLRLAGNEIWPPTHNDPRIKGPQPRILTRQQRKAMEKWRREMQDGEITVNGKEHNK